MGQRKIRVFTSAAFNYLPKLRMLCESIRKFHPEFEIYWAIADEIPDWADLENEPIDGIIRLGDLGIENYQRWAFGLNLIELSTAIKPFAAKYLLNLPQTKAVFYFDPDMVLFSKLDDMVGELRRSSILLTPHQTEPESKLEAIVDNEIGSLRHGIYNLGYFGIANDKEGRRFADWWAERLFLFCHADLERHLWTDQKWINFAPVFFERVGVLKSPRFNVAAWNITTRKMKEVSPWKFTINGVPLGFYHFSGFDSGAHKIMATKYAGHNRAVMKLVKWYEKQMKLLSDDKYESLPWGYARFDDQTPITDVHRKIYRDRPDLQKAYPQPFSTSGSHSYAAWFKDRARLEYPQFFGGSRHGELNQFLISLKFFGFLAKRTGKIDSWIDEVKIGVDDFSGWGWAASDTHEITDIRILMRKGSFGKIFIIQDGICTINQPRPDVKAAHPEFNEHTGFFFRAPLSKLQNARLFGFQLTLSNGHVIRIRSNLRPVLSRAAKEIVDQRSQQEARLSQIIECAKHRVIIFDHQLGGGANSYRIRMIRNRLRAGQSVALVTYDLSTKKYNLRIEAKPHQAESIVFDELESLQGFLNKNNFSEIFLNNLVSYDRPLDCIAMILKIRPPKAKLVITTHDFFSICPSWTLIDDTGLYCGVPDLSRCRSCMENNTGLFSKLVKERDVPEWRAAWKEILKESTQILCFSKSSKNILLRAYPKLDSAKIKVRPHTVSYIKGTVKISSDESRIAIVGEISSPKGSHIVAEMVRLIKERKLKTKITIIGTIEEKLDRSIVKVTGRYDHVDLPELIRNSGAQLVLLPFVWPETFSYVTQELIQLGVPIAVFDIGAPAERIRRYARGIIIHRIDAAAALDAVEQYFSVQRKPRMPTSSGRVVLQKKMNSLSSLARR